MSVAITAEKVKELRERTGSGMMECKKALVAANGDIEAAIVAMRESGQVKAVKKAGRVAAEGIIIASVAADHKTAVLLEINSETDFVARDTNFNEFAKTVADCALAGQHFTLDNLLEATLDNGETIEITRQNLVAKIGENIQIRRIAGFKTQHQLAHYIHGGRIGVLVEYQGGTAELGKDLAMHIAATNPIVIAPTDVPEQLVAQETEIFTAQAAESGKPADIIEKMVGGRIKKFLDEVSLLGQPFVKDPNITISDLLQQAHAQVLGFVRFEVGEGIEKKQDDFVAEVMAQASKR